MLDKQINRNDFYYMLVLFIFAIQTPLLWLFGLGLLLFVIIIRWSESTLLTNGFIIRSVLLIIFIVSYYSSLVSYNFVNVKLASQFGFAIIAMYWIGYSVKETSVSNWPRSLEWIILALLAGLVIFAFLCVNKGGYSSMDIFSDEYMKTSPNFWYGGQEINRPGLGAFAALGMCQLPVLIFGDRSRSFLNIKLVVLTVILFGFYVCIILANRTPFIALALSFSATLLIRIVRNRTSHLIRNIIIATIVVTLIYFYFAPILSKMYIMQRLLLQGLDTAGRFDSWIAMTSNLFEYPNGGRIAPIAGNSYVHNLWLDVAWDAGLVPFIALLLFHLGHIKSAITILRSKESTNLLLLLTCTSVAFLTNFMQEPTMAASALYFASSCFILGLMQRYSSEIHINTVTV